MNKQERLALLECMLRIRRFEEGVIHLAMTPEYEYVGRQHLYIGAEGAGAGACLALGKDDLAHTTHRNHGYLVARGSDRMRMFAEILGRADGTNLGRGGSWHICDPDVGFRSTSAMVGGSIALAVGSAYALQKQKSKAISVAHFGDGTLDEGIGYEALNIASLFKLPVLFMCENNSKPGQRPSSMLAAKHLSHVPAALDMPTKAVNGADVEAVHLAAKEAVDHVRSGKGPYFLQADLERWPGSHQVHAAFPTGVTDISLAWDEGKIEGKNADWTRTYDPIRLYAKKLLGENAVTRDELTALDRKVADETDKLRATAVKSPFPPADAAAKQFA
ncbi:MAG TPA: thiamine pyrophosphate-dependent dehydrogenase E1 component subunit alpha [Alphaproteobacteria bacterium]